MTHQLRPTVLRSFTVTLAMGLAILFASETMGDSLASPTIDFAREIRPILSKNCFQCHGPDEEAREAELRLDTSEGAQADLGDYQAVVPGNSQESELFLRVISDDDDLKMPPSDSKHFLSPEQIELLRQWIDQGGAYQPHWAFAPPHAPPLPTVSQKTWPRNDLDYFVLARMEREGLKPSPEADRHTLIRRVSLDLIGLLPSPKEIDDFVNDTRPDAYERLVDRLIASPRYGERWARRWLDVARYADTNGYEKDRARSIWPYRDWVINAINAGMPFDQFTVEQLAGDMLPDATQDQLIATGFHRNTMHNEEGGIDPEEYRYYSLVDRVNTTGTAWLGLTVGCSQCHTHKYDPITHTEYFALLAFFNNVDEPSITLPEAKLDDEREQVEEKAREMESELEAKFPLPPEFDWTVLKPQEMSATNGTVLKMQGDHSVLATEVSPDKEEYTLVMDADLTGVSVIRLEVLNDPSLPGGTPTEPAGGPGRAGGNFVLSEFVASVASSGDSPPRQLAIERAEADYHQPNHPIELAFDGNLATGWAIAVPGGQTNKPRTALFHLSKKGSIEGQQ